MRSIVLIVLLKLFLAIFVSTIYFDSVNAQQVEMIGDEATREMLFSKVKQIDEFIHRFNFNQNKFNPETINVYSRAEQIPLLFDKQYKSKNEQDIRDFTQAALYSSELSFYNSKWFAKVKCDANYQGKKVTMDLVLKVELNPNGGSSWTIAGVHAPVLFVEAECNDPAKMIPPSNNEVGFAGLSRVFNDKDNLSAYYPQEFEVDYLSVLLYAVKTGQINFIQARSIQYYFYDVNNWIFMVDYFNREQKNSGWLISEAIPIEDKHKEDYLNKQLNLRR